ncbi:MAG TPA: hypothetical protein PKH18_13920 [Ottowia sp.]|nr:hypothetical protein [Ottowia sp.]HQQ52533.1 hypothetical protein [Ottowia sp.]
MRHPYTLIGLTPSERALLESLFALERDTSGAMVPTPDPREAHLIVVNGDDHTLVEQLRQDNPRALIVLAGHPAGAPVTGLPVLRRPFDMPGVIEVLSGLDWPAGLPCVGAGEFDRTFVSSAPTSSQLDTGAPPAVDPLAFAPTTASAPLAPAPQGRAVAVPDRAPVSSRAAWARSELAPPPWSAAAAAAPGGFVDDREAEVLVVTGALGERSLTLPRGIRRLGLRVRLLDGPAAVLAALDQGAASFVFLDQLSLGEQLLPLARALAARRAGNGAPPHVVVVARRGTPLDRLRARLAGCHWMQVPIDGPRLVAFFARRGLRPRDGVGPAFSSTPDDQ